MTLQFDGGPNDGYTAKCPFAPPPAFYLPTAEPLVASVYTFDFFAVGLLNYIFSGYLRLSPSEAKALFD
jgi:hypothetical protein